MSRGKQPSTGGLWVPDSLWLPLSHLQVPAPHNSGNRMKKGKKKGATVIFQLPLKKVPGTCHTISSHVHKNCVSCVLPYVTIMMNFSQAGGFNC